jgi:hypothetical protein
MMFRVGGMHHFKVWLSGMQLSRHLNARSLLVGLFVLFQAACWYFAYLSGRATNIGGGQTHVSLDLDIVSAILGNVAMVLGVRLIAMQQTGGVFVRLVKVIATLVIWSALLILSVFVIQSLAAP